MAASLTLSSCSRFLFASLVFFVLCVPGVIIVVPRDIFSGGDFNDATVFARALVTRA